MTAKHTDWRAPILALRPCPEAVEWLATQTDAASAWTNCTRGDWMLWLCGKLAGKPWSKARRKLVLAACSCARLALPYNTGGDDRPRLAIETAERWAWGRRVTRQQVRDATAAGATTAGAAASYASYAAYAYASYAASYAAAYAAAASYAASYAAAASYASYATTCARILAQCADIVRQHYLEPPEIPQ